MTQGGGAEEKNKAEAVRSHLADLKKALAVNKRKAEVKPILDAQAKRLPLYLTQVAISQPKHVTRLMARTISQLRRGDIKPDIARTVAMLAKVALEALIAQDKKTADEVVKDINGTQIKIRRIIEVSPANPEQSVSGPNAGHHAMHEQPGPAGSDTDSSGNDRDGDCGEGGGDA